MALDSCLVQAATHHLHICRGVTMSGGDLSVTEPRLDSQQVDPRLQQGHREGVSEHMRRDWLSCERGHMVGCRGDSATNDVSGAEARQTSSMDIGEKRNSFTPTDAAFTQQPINCCDKLARQGHEALLAAFAAKENLWVRSVQRQVRGLDAERLGDPGPGTGEEQQ